MVESWTCDMEVEQHATSVSPEIGFQGVGAVNRPDALSFGRIVKRAQRNGYVEVGLCNKARKLNNGLKNVRCSVHPKSTPSQDCDGDEKYDIKDRKCLRHEDNVFEADNEKGLSANEVTGSSFKNTFDTKLNGLFAGHNNDDDSGTSYNTRNDQSNDSHCTDSRNDVSNHKIDATKQNGRCPIMARNQKRQLSINGRCSHGNHAVQYVEDFVKCDYCEEGSTNTNSSCRGPDNHKVFHSLEEKCQIPLVGVNHSKCGVGFCVKGEDSKTQSSVKNNKNISYSCRNCFLGHKCVHLGKDSHCQDFKRVRLKNSPVKCSRNDVTENSNLPTRSECIAKSCRSSEELGEKECRLNGCDNSRDKVIGSSDIEIFKNVNMPNDTTYHTKQKSRNYNTTTKVKDSNFVKDEINKRTSRFGDEKTFSNNTDKVSSSCVDLPTTVNHKPSNNAPTGNDGCKSADGHDDKTGNLSSMVCSWVNCDAVLKDAMELKTHVKDVHVKTMAASDLFFCFWKGCKVYNKPSSSYNWLVKHVNTHVGIRPFQCVIEPCSLSFASHGALIRHVQSHFNERSKYYRNPKKPVKEAATSPPGRTEDALSGSESTSSSKDSKQKQAKIFMRRTRHSKPNFVNDDFDRDSMMYIRRKLFHLENTPEKSTRINGLRSIVQPVGRRTLEDRSQFLMSFSSSEKKDKWYNDSEILFGGVCQLPISHLPRDQQDKLYVDVFGVAKQRRGRKHRKKLVA